MLLDYSSFESSTYISLSNKETLDKNKKITLNNSYLPQLASRRLSESVSVHFFE